MPLRVMTSRPSLSVWEMPPFSKRCFTSVPGAMPSVDPTPGPKISIDSISSPYARASMTGSPASVKRSTVSPSGVRSVVNAS